MLLYISIYELLINEVEDGNSVISLDGTAIFILSNMKKTNKNNQE